jgi:molybdopterin/thiamine biosynthesis adenylyltransferase
MRPLHIVVAGAGGNSGSHLLPHLARMSGVSRLTLVDPDFYEAGNIGVQNIDASDVGKPKVTAQAAKLRRIRHDLDVEARQERIEDVPRGLLRSDLLVSCLDSRGSRQHMNEIAWRLNTPWLDCGVLGSQVLARVSAYVPSYDSPCLECAWSTGAGGDYSLLEQEYLCAAGDASSFPSKAPSGLGALAASLLAIEIEKFLCGNTADSLSSRQLILDAEHRIIQVTAERRNPWCRFDHQTWAVKPWVCDTNTMTVREALGMLGSLQVDGHCFVSELVCPGCGRREAAPRLNRPLARCSSCNRRMASTGFGSIERLEPEFANGFMDRTLAEVGLQAGDIVSSRDLHVQVTGAA